MKQSVKFILKFSAMLLFLGLAIFLTQVGKYYFQIKSGAAGTSNFSAVQDSAESAEKYNAGEILSGSAPAFGALNPELTVVEFASFSCPHSIEASKTTRELMIKNQNRVKFIYRDFPIDALYQDSSALALMGRCANEQGKFWPFHDKLQYSELSPQVAAAQINLDEKKFWSCVKEQKYLKDIEGDLTDALNNYVRGTPTFFFIKKGYEDKPVKIEGAIPKETFEKIINKLLE